MSEKQRQDMVKTSCSSKKSLSAEQHAQQQRLGDTLGMDCTALCQHQTKVAMKKVRTAATKAAKALSHALQHSKLWIFKKRKCSAAFIYGLALCEKGPRRRVISCQIGAERQQYKVGCGCSARDVASVVLRGTMHPAQVPGCFETMEAWTIKEPNAALTPTQAPTPSHSDPDEGLERPRNRSES